ncbi:hypothetical protein BDV06DRAFT_205346 [Aspergillus oleicola]
MHSATSRPSLRGRSSGSPVPNTRDWRRNIVTPKLEPQLADAEPPRCTNPSYMSEGQCQWSNPAENLGKLVILRCPSLRSAARKTQCPEKDNGSAWRYGNFLRMLATQIVLFPSGPSSLSVGNIRRPIRSYLCLACCYSGVATRRWLAVCSAVALQGKRGSYRDWQQFLLQKIISLSYDVIKGDGRCVGLLAPDRSTSSETRVAPRSPTLPRLRAWL